MADSLSSTDCADLRRFWKWSHPNSSASPLAGNTFSIGYTCVTDVCVQLNEDSGPMPLIEVTDYTIDTDAGTIFFTAAGATSIFISNTTTVDVWFNVLVCSVVQPCLSQPCCEDSKDDFVYSSVRPPNCVPVPMISFSPASGTTQSFPLTVTLTVDRDDAVIYYTTDGTEPTIDSTAYTTPFELTDSDTIVKAMGIVPGCMQGDTAVAQWINLPIACCWYIADALSLSVGAPVDTFPDSSGLGNNLTGVQSPVFASPPPSVVWPSYGYERKQNPVLGIVQTGMSWAYVVKLTALGVNNPLTLFEVNHATLDGALHSNISGVASALSVKDLIGTISIKLGVWQIITFSQTTSGVLTLKTNDGVLSNGGGSNLIAIDDVNLFMDIGAMKEAIVYPFALSSGQMDNVRNYLSNKYGIPITV